MNSSTSGLSFQRIYQKDHSQVSGRRTPMEGQSYIRCCEPNL
jgi:hypothetical protein